jgi:hypothetical protein
MTTPEFHEILNNCGFYRTNTGGGCDGMIRMFSNVSDSYIIMTQADDPSAPEANEDVTIGFYASNGENLYWTATAAEAISFARSLNLRWLQPSVPVPNYSGSGEWIYEATYRGIRVACGYNDAGPVAWAGHPTEDRWIDSVACDGSFLSGAKRAVELADEVLSRPDLLKLLQYEPKP